jgi:ABC-2 type transport system ATP-binding protein
MTLGTAAPPAPQATSPRPRSDDAIRIEHLTKRYGTFTAVDDVSLRVEAGDFFGFLGPNGAGKTTTINSIVGLAQIASGSIAVFGYDAVRDWRAARRQIGLAPQEYNFDRYLSIRDVLIYQAGYYGVPRRAVRKRADELLERFDLTSKANQVYTRLSGGMKRRLSLARALIHEPRLLILDEPTAGVDVELRLELWDLLRELNAAGTTIFLTTHYLEEAETLCRNIGIIEGGHLVALEPTPRLLERHGSATLNVRVGGDPGRLLAALGARATLDADGRTLTIEDVRPADVSGLLADVAAAGLKVETVDYGRASLQRVFLELTRR